MASVIVGGGTIAPWLYKLYYVALPRSDLLRVRKQTTIANSSLQRGREEKKKYGEKEERIPQVFSSAHSELHPLSFLERKISKKREKEGMRVNWDRLLSDLKTFA